MHNDGCILHINYKHGKLNGPYIVWAGTNGGVPVSAEYYIENNRVGYYQKWDDKGIPLGICGSNVSYVSKGYQNTKCSTNNLPADSPRNVYPRILNEIMPLWCTN
jgi:hypothetical protein